MPLNPDAVGSKSKPGEKHWDSKDAILYALGVGCGVDDLPFNTENTKGVQQQVLPTMGVVLGVAGGGAYDAVGEINWTMLVHGEQAIELHKPIPVEGTVRSVTTVTGIYDKGSGAVLVTETESVDAKTDEPLFTTRSAAFIRGEGGWGGDRGPTGPRPTAPGARAGSRREVPDRNRSGAHLPLVRATATRCTPIRRSAAAGFDKPILHGLCTYGFTGRALLDALCDDDPARFQVDGGSLPPVSPGRRARRSIWRPGRAGAYSRPAQPGDVVMVDNGRGPLHADDAGRPRRYPRARAPARRRPIRAFPSNHVRLRDRRGRRCWRQRGRDTGRVHGDRVVIVGLDDRRSVRSAVDRASADGPRSGTGARGPAARLTDAGAPSARFRRRPRSPAEDASSERHRCSRRPGRRTRASHCRRR